MSHGQNALLESAYALAYLNNIIFCIKDWERHSTKCKGQHKLFETLKPKKCVLLDRLNIGIWDSTWAMDRSVPILIVHLKLWPA